MFEQSFLVLTQLHCSWPIATKGFGRAVSPLFCPAFAGSFPYLSNKEVPDLCKINLFTLILFNIFLWKYCHVLLSCSQHPWNQSKTRSTILEGLHKIWSLNIYPSISNIGQHLFLISFTIYWTSTLDCSKLAPTL